jgi:hypothetical protein
MMTVRLPPISRVNNRASASWQYQTQAVLEATVSWFAVTTANEKLTLESRKIVDCQHFDTYRNISDICIGDVCR